MLWKRPDRLIYFVTPIFVMVAAHVNSSVDGTTHADNSLCRGSIAHYM